MGGRRKATKSRHKNDGGNIDKDPACMTPKEPKCPRGVNGKLSHTNRITNFFTPVKKEDDESITHYLQPVKEEEDDEKIIIQFFESLPIRGENPETSNSSERKYMLHKIQHGEEMPQSPSSALQQLRISHPPKKAGKTRRRLNPSQAGNQQVSLPAKAVCCTKQEPVSHQLTEYFPVRRSERKTKRAVLQERQHQIEAAILAGSEDGLQVHNFEGKGRGVVATRLFCKGEFVVEYAGELIDMAEAKLRERAYAQDQNTGCYMYYFHHRNNQYCVDATTESGRLGRLVNHSRNGNLLTKTVEIDNQPHLVLIAREDIAPGEEVTYDYGDRSKESIRYHPWLLS